MQNHLGHEYGCDKEGDGNRAIGTPISLAMSPGVHAEASHRSTAVAVSNSTHALVPIFTSSRRATHCSGVTSVEGRPHKHHSIAAGGVLSTDTRRRAPSDVMGPDAARCRPSRSNGPASSHTTTRQPRRGVQFTTDDGDGGRNNSDTDGADSDASGDASSADEGRFSRGPGPRKSHILELPALPASGATSAAAKGPTASSAGPAGVTLSFLETLRTTSRPGTTLWDLYWSLVLPATRAARCAYVTLLGAEYRARPTHVVVCSWDEQISDVVDCVTSHLAAFNPQAAAAAATAANNAPAAAAAAAAAAAGVISSGAGARLMLRRSAEQPLVDHPSPASAIGLSFWPSFNAPGAHDTSGASRSPSPGPSPGAGAGGGGNVSAAAAAGPPVALWLDLLAVNFHPLASSAGTAAATAAAAAGGYYAGAGAGAAARLSFPPSCRSAPPLWNPQMTTAMTTAAVVTPSLEEASLARVRALPSAVASVRHVVLLPGSQGAGLREPAVTMAAWHVLRGRGCAQGGATLAVAAPPEVDLALLQAAFQGLSVSAARRQDEDDDGTAAAAAAGYGAVLHSGVGLGGEPLSPSSAAAAVAPAGGSGAAGNLPSSFACNYASLDRVAMRAVREGAASGAAAAAAAAAIYAADPLPSRTVREGLMAAATAAANTLLSRPVGMSSGRPSLQLQIATSLPPALAAAAVAASGSSGACPCSMSVQQAASPRMQVHAVLQTRSFSVNALEPQSSLSYSPSPLSASRPSLLSSPLKSGPSGGASFPGGTRALQLAGESWSSTTAAALLPPTATAVAVSSSVGLASAVAHSLPRDASGRSMSFNALPLAHSNVGSNDDASGISAAATGNTACDLHLKALDGGGGGGSGLNRRARGGSTFSGGCGGGGGGADVARSSWAAAALAAAAPYENAAGASAAGEAPAAPRRPRNLIPPLEVPVPSLPSPTALPPALSPAFGDHHAVGGVNGSGRMVQLRSSAVAPWEASPPLPTLPVRAPSGITGTAVGSGGRITSGGGARAHSSGGSDDAAAAAAATPAVSVAAAPPVLQQASGLASLTPRGWSSLESQVPLSQPLPRLAPLLTVSSAATPLAALPTAAPTAPLAPLTAALTSTAAVAASAPLPAPLPYQDAVAADAAAAAGLMATPFGRIRRGHNLQKGHVNRGTTVAVRTFAAGAGSDLDRDSDFPSDAECELDLDSGSEGPATVMESLSSFLGGQALPVRADCVEKGHSPPSDAGQQSRNGGSCGVGGGGKASLGISPSAGGDGSGAAATAAAIAAAAEPRPLPPAPDSPALYGLAPYRPLAPDLARLVSTGRLLAALGQSATALRVVRHALAAARSFHGSNHPDTARCAAALGWLLIHCQQQQEQQQQQKPLRRGSGGGGRRGRSPSRAVSSVAPSPPRVGATAASPGRKYLGLASPPVAPLTSGSAAGAAAAVGGSPLEEAELLLRSASAVLERFLGHNHPETLTARQGLGTVLIAMGRHDEAIPLLQRAATGREARRRPLSEIAVGSAIDLATCLAATGRDKEARKLLRAQLVRLQEDEDEAAAVVAAAAMAAAGGGGGGGWAATSASATASIGSAASSTSVPTGAGSSTSTTTASGNTGGGGGGGATAMSSLLSSSASLFSGSRPQYGNGGGGADGSGSGCGSPVVATNGTVVHTSSLSSTSTPAAAAAPQQPHSSLNQPSPQPPMPRGMTPRKREELKARCAHQLAQLKAACGKAHAARILYRSAVQRYATVYGSGHPITAGCMLSLAALNQSLREYGEALELYRTVLELYVEMYGPHHPATSRVSNRLGDLEEMIEEATEAGEPESM